MKSVEFIDLEPKDVLIYCVYVSAEDPSEKSIDLLVFVVDEKVEFVFVSQEVVDSFNSDEELDESERKRLMDVSIFTGRKTLLEIAQNAANFADSLVRIDPSGIVYTKRGKEFCFTLRKVVPLED